MGGDEQLDIEYKIVHNVCGLDFNDYLKDKKLLTKDLFENNLDKIMKIIKSRHNSRIAYQVVGRFVLLLGIDIPIETKNFIIHAADWRYEEDLWSVNFLEERKFYLKDFRKKILTYRSGVPNPLIEDL